MPAVQIRLSWLRRSTVSAFFCLAVLALLPQRAQAWWDTGHMVVAQIAYDNVQPEVRKWADGLIATVTANYPTTHNFVEAATWPDDLKQHGITVYNTWHYTNIPLNDDGVAISCAATPDIDAVWAINQARNILSNPKSTAFEKGEFLAFLLHFVGDLHQPLHSTSMYTNALPGGDQGGNLFPLKDSIHTNLHKLWDDGCGYFDQYSKVERKLGPENWVTTIEKMAKAITKAYPKKDILGLMQLDPEFWAMESHAYAVDNGFKGLQGQEGYRKLYLKPNETPSPSYIAAGQQVVELRLATAGYRLAMILEELYAKLNAK